MQLIRDCEDIHVVNEQLERMGHSIGSRLIDEFLAKSGVSNCSNFKETADTIAKVAFKMFLGVTAEVANMSADGQSFSLIISDNPLTDYVEIPPQYQDLCYCKLLCGVIKGALEMVLLQVECQYVKDVLKGDDVSEIRVELKGVVKNVMAEEYNES
jgi:hypothetical protein